MKKNTVWRRLILLFIALTAAFLLISIASCLRQIQKISSMSISMDNEYIFISAQHESNPLRLENTANTINEFRRLHNLLKTSGYKYYEMYRQPLDCYSSSSRFYDANTGELSSSCRQASCIQLSPNVFSDFDLTLSSGREFNEEDYAYRAGKRIPVIMGYNYSKLYKEEDIFTADYLFSPFEFQVVGFLNKDSRILLSIGTIDLNNYIIIPSIEFIDHPRTDEDYVTQKIHYANKTSGKTKVEKRNFQDAYSCIVNALSSSSVGEYSIATSSLEDYCLAQGFNLQHIRSILYSLSVALSLVGLICSCRWISQVGCRSTYLFRSISTFSVIILSFTVSLVPAKIVFTYFGFAKYITPESVALLLSLGILYLSTVLLAIFTKRTGLSLYTFTIFRKIKRKD